MSGLRRRTMCCAVVLLAASTAGAAGYEAYGPRPVRDVLTASEIKGPYHRVNDPVVAYGYRDSFTVSSNFGEFQVAGDGALRKLLHEIAAIAELEKQKKSSSFVKGVGNAAKAPFQLTKSLIQHPVDTVTGVPKGVWQLTENAGTAVSNVKDPTEDSRTAQVLKMSSFKREIAAKLGVDPYSSNKVLQKELNSLAWAQTVGDWSVSFALAPLSGAAPTIVSTMRMTNSVNNALKEEPPARLRIMNDQKLAQAGVPEDLRKRYLDHPAFSPRHDTILAEALAGIGAVQGVPTIVEAALAAEDEADANFYTQLAQILRGYHEGKSPLAQIAIVDGVFTARATDGSLLVPLPVDRVVWTANADAISQRLVASRASGATGTLDVWMTGTASPRARTELEKRGFAVSERIATKIAILD